MAQATWLADAIRQEFQRHGHDAQVIERPNWKTRGWGDPSDFLGGQGEMQHHTGSNSASGNAPALIFIESGSEIAPLSNVVTARNADVYIVAAGKANHAGVGGPWRTVPVNAANGRMFANEIENNGVGEQYPAKQMTSVRLVALAILKHQKRDHTWTIGHKEWTSRKIDPSFAMDTFRRSVKALMTTIKVEFGFGGTFFARLRGAVKRQRPAAKRAADKVKAGGPKVQLPGIVVRKRKG